MNSFRYLGSNYPTNLQLYLREKIPRHKTSSLCSASVLRSQKPPQIHLTCPCTVILARSKPVPRPVQIACKIQPTAFHRIRARDDDKFAGWSALK